MHFLVAFFAFFFSFGHAQSLAAHGQPRDAFIPPAQYAQGFDQPVPSRHAALQATYAGRECPGCQMTTVSYSTRLN